jgi:hypothetical protein
MHLRRPLIDVALAARRHVTPPVTRDETEAPFRTSLAIFVCVVALLSSTACASAEVREDGADAPRVLVRVSKVGQWQRLLTVRLIDPGSGERIRRANLIARASMNLPGHSMSLAPTRLLANDRGTYRAKIQFVMAGTWTINITASRPDTPPLRQRLRVEIPLDEPPDAPKPS